jgi:hypothetical protein
VLQLALQLAVSPACQRSVPFPRPCHLPLVRLQPCIEVRSVHPGVRRARPRLARQPSPSSAIPASACIQPKPAHASLRRAGPQNAQIGAPVKAPEPGPLVETGQDWSRLVKTAPAMSLPKEPGRNVMLSTPASTYQCARATTQTGSRRTNTSSVMREQCRLRAVARVGPVSSRQRLCAH